MTDAKFQEKKFEIVKNYFQFFSILDLSDDLGITVSSSTPDIYHVFSTGSGTLTHEYSVSADQLEKLSQSIKLSTIKKIFIETKLRSLEIKCLKKNYPESFNPLNHEQTI